MQIDLDSAWIGGELVAGVRLSIADGRIAAIAAAPVRGTGCHALPAFVNAHCHLDLSSIAGEKLAHGSFAEWLAALLPERACLDAAAIDAAIDAGIASLLATGTAAVGDIDSFGRSAARLAASPLTGVVFREVLGRSDGARIRALVDELAQPLPDGTGESLRPGISPHAPYSTAPELFDAAVAAATEHGWRVASHVAESGDEEDLLRDGSGPLAELFRRLGFQSPRWGSGPRPTVAPLFARLPATAPFVVIHGNRLTRHELELCVARRWPVVYCPRSHRYFGHARHPAAELLAAGGILALGTDSRASNEGLDLWAELACFRAADPSVADAAILAAATRGGRLALGLPAAELRPGEPATFQIVGRRDGAPLLAGDLVAAAVRGELATRSLWCRGRIVAGR